MARQARKESKTGYYHIMTHGINREYIFQFKIHKQKILTIIDEKKQEGFKVLAYCVMDNHLHLVVHTSKEVLIEVMKRINITYSMFYNRRENRIGALFQDRYKSEIIEDERHLLGAIRYVHNNPITAGMVERIEDYEWSSIKEYTGDKKILLNEQEIRWLMDKFKDANDFIKFHHKEDHIEYLEMSEEIDKNREESAMRIIEEYFIEKGMNDKKELKDKEELISRLLKDSKLSYRRIAQITETSLNKVYSVSKNNKG